jgi:hypothetical protein
MPGAVTAKKSLPATERDTPRVQQARPVYRQRPSMLELRRLQCVDEAGVKLAMTRLDGRAPQGARVIGTVPQTEGEDLTLVGAVGLQGVQAVMTVRGATEAEVFRTSVTQVLGPTLAPGEVVVLDNLAAHKAGGVQQALARRGWGALVAALRARSVAHSVVGEPPQNGLAGRQSAYARSPRDRPQDREGPQHRPRPTALVQAVWLCLTMTCKPL